MARILSVQSQVSYGHVGNAAVMFPLQSLGHEVWPVPTAVLSNHAGYPDTGGECLSADFVAGLLSGLAARGAIKGCDVVLSGYLGSADVGGVLLHALDRARGDGARAIYCCDPVIGDDDTGLYVDDSLRDFFRDRAVPSADVLSPNLFELEQLCRLAPGSLRDASLTDVLDTARGVVARMRAGGRMLVTSLVLDGLAPDSVAMLALDASEAWMVQTPRLEFAHAPHGTGDLASALFAARLAEADDLPMALSDTTSRLFAVLEETARQGETELRLVDARARIVDPRKEFEPIRVG